MELTIHGKIPAKSSSRRLITNRKTGRPMIISSAKTIAYEKDFAKQITGDMKQKLGGDKYLGVIMLVYTPHFRQDIDSFPKVVLDCLQKNDVILNDNKVNILRIHRILDKKNPRVHLLITELD